MEKHVKNYHDALGYRPGDFIACELCGGVGNQIHHIEPRSSFGSKRKHEQDAPSNLVCLCFKCHEAAHGPESRKIKMELKELVTKRLSHV